jgi:uncharacterized damage-inducible protein DinB
MSFLDYYRAVLARKCVGLRSDQLQLTVAASTLTLGALLRHMAFVEDHWFQSVLLGRPLPEPWLGADWEAQPDWEMDTSADCTPTELIEQFDEAVARSRAAIDGLDVETTAANCGEPTNLRWILVHMIEEYARHCGHTDLLREAIDGATGD